MIMVVAFKPPSNIVGNRKAESVIIDIMSLPSPSITLDLYSRAKIFRTRKLFSAFKLIELTSTTLAGLPAQKMVYTHSSIFKVTQIWTVKGNKAYAIVYANIAKEPHLPPVVQKMIDSFEIVSEPQTANLNTQTVTEMIAYENPRFGLRIKYPPDWIVDERNSIPSDNQKYSEIVGFLSAKEANSDLLGELEERLVIEAKVISSPNVSLEDYASDHINHLMKTFKSVKFTLIESTAITLPENILAQKIVYKIGAHNGGTIKTMEVLTIKDNRAFIIRFGAESSKYNDYLSIAQKMMDSFQIFDVNKSTAKEPLDIEENEYDTYQNQAFGFKIRYPHMESR
jgi:hypothetical protein